MDKSKIFYDFSSLRFKLLSDAYSNLTKKIMETFKIIISITPIIIGIGYYLLKITFSPLSLILFSISIILFLVTIIIGIYSFDPVDIELTDPLEFYNKYFNLDASDLLEQIAVNVGDDCSDISSLLDYKSKILRKLLISFSLTLSSLFFAFISLFIEDIMLLFRN